MPDSALCTEEEITQLVYAFYTRIQQDKMLGPIFDLHITDWDHHLVKMVDFWSSILRGTGRFRGTPMPKHIALPSLNAELFQQWLKLFHQTAAEQPNQAMAEQACVMADRIARSLWMGYQINHHPDVMPMGLAHG
jgi:hemoglobin